MAAVSSADDGLLLRDIVRETAVLTVRRPLVFLLLPWALVCASSAGVWALTHLGVGRWLVPLHMGFAGGSDAAVVSFLAHLVLAIAVTTPLIMLVDKPDFADLWRISVPAATVARRVIEIAAISTIIAVPVLALAPGSVILPISLAGIAFGKALPSLLASLGAVAVASALAWLLATQSVALPVAVIEGAGFGSLRRSWRLTRGHRWRIAALLGPLVLGGGLISPEPEAS